MKESFIKRRSYVDLIGAIVTGLCVGFILAWTRSSGDEFHIHAFIKIILLAVFSYSLVALLLIRWKSRPMRKVPNWILIALVGSFINFLSVNLIPDVQYIWRFRNSNVVGYASGAIQEEIIRIIGSTIIDSLIALPIMGTFEFINRKSRVPQQDTPTANTDHTA